MKLSGETLADSTTDEVGPSSGAVLMGSDAPFHILLQKVCSRSHHHLSRNVLACACLSEFR